MSAADAIFAARFENRYAICNGTGTLTPIVMQFLRTCEKLQQNRCTVSVPLQSAEMKIAIGADHAGYQLKDSLKKLARRDGRRSTRTSAPRRRSRWTTRTSRKAVAEGVAGGQFDRGILVCGTGVGMAIAANKVPGVRSAPIVDTDTAKLSREHNDLNVLTLGARVLPESRAREIVKTFLQTPFEGGRHAARVDKIHGSKVRSRLATVTSTVRRTVELLERL